MSKLSIGLFLLVLCGTARADLIPHGGQRWWWWWWWQWRRWWWWWWWLRRVLAHRPQEPSGGRRVMCTVALGRRLRAMATFDATAINILINDPNWRYSETPVVKSFGSWGELYCAQVKA